MRLSAVLFAALFTLPAASPAQAPPAAPSAATVPVTKILAIGSMTRPDAMADANKILPQEVPATVRLYLAGKIDSWYVRKDTRGVVFLMNVTTVEEAHSLLEKLPLGVAGLMKFDLIPIGPLSPLNYLLTPPAKP